MSEEVVVIQAKIKVPPISPRWRRFEGTEEDARRRRLKERVRNLTEAYREKLGEPSDQLVPALGAWLVDFSEDVIRQGITATAVAGIPGTQARYDYLKAWLRSERAAKRRGQ